MYARTPFTIRLSIFIAGTTYLLMFGAVNSVQGRVESQEKSPLIELRQSQVQILQVGEFLCEITAEPNEVWLGLYPTKDGYSLMSSELRVDAFYDPTIGDDEDVTGATRVSVNGLMAPLFLITGLDTLKTGMVKTLFSGRLPLPLDGSLEFTLDNGIKYYVAAFEGVKTNTGVIDHTVELVQGNRSQVICSFDATNAAVSYLLWAGDLDRDGRLDVLIDTVCDYNASGPALFLSSPAKHNNLLRKVAQLETTPMLN